MTTPTQILDTIITTALEQTTELSGNEINRLFNAAAALDPKQAYLYQELAQEVIETIDNPEYAGAHNGKGASLHELGQYEQAIQSYDKSLEIDPEDAMVHDNMGEALTALSLFKDAKKYLDYAAHVAQLENNDDLILSIDENLELLTEAKRELKAELTMG